MDLEALKDFNLVAMHGGFGKASRLSGIPKATLSRRVRDLEESLGVRLLERGARALALTEEGASLHVRTKGLLAELLEAEQALVEGAGRLRGRLRVSAPVLLSHTTLGRIAAEFSKAHPQVQLEIVAEDRMVDPVEDGYDLIIRINPRRDSVLVGRCFLRDHFVAVIPARWRIKTDPDSLTRASLPAAALISAPEPVQWKLVLPSGAGAVLRPEVSLRLSSLLMIRDAVLAGTHAAILPRSIISDELKTNHLTALGRVADRDVELWMLHSSRRLLSPKVAAFMRHLDTAFAER
jgi:DNA-binding transcriptional LysR family regulator